MGFRFGAILVVLLGFALAKPAAADVATLRVVVPPDLAALSLIVAAHDHLVEKQAAARGLAGVTVQWLTPNGGNPIEQLVNGQADVVATTDLVGFLLAWDERSGTPQEIRGLAALARMPYQLLSRNPAIATIRDFTAKDRIAVPALGVSLPAIMLEMASAGAEDEDIETVGIKADISSPMHLVYAADAADPPRLFVFSGNTMGSFDPLAQIRSVAQCLKPGDRLLVDGDTKAPAVTHMKKK